VRRAILYGGLTAGLLDIIDAFVFFGVRSGARPMGVLHSIAGGLIGHETARAGGWTTALLGLFLHFLIATIIAAVYVIASRRLPALRRQWVVCGLAFGVVAFFVMTWFVVPLSRVGAGVTFALPATPSLINGLLIHAFGVGLPIAWFAREDR
jgi:uncharacterized membrane protein YagU involved in acid resistance